MQGMSSDAHSWHILVGKLVPGQPGLLAFTRHIFANDLIVCIDMHVFLWASSSRSSKCCSKRSSLVVSLAISALISNSAKRRIENTIIANIFICVTHEYKTVLDVCEADRYMRNPIHCYWNTDATQQSMHQSIKKFVVWIVYNLVYRHWALNGSQYSGY